MGSAVSFFGDFYDMSTRIGKFKTEAFFKHLHSFKYVIIIIMIIIKCRLYQGSSVSSTETDINTRLAKSLTAIDRLSVIWKSDLTAVMWILLYGCTTWTLSKRMEKKLDSNYTRMLRTSPGGSSLQSSSCTATYHPSRKLSQLDEPNCWTLLKG